MGDGCMQGRREGVLSWLEAQPERNSGTRDGSREVHSRGSVGTLEGEASSLRHRAGRIEGRQSLLRHQAEQSEIQSEECTSCKI